MSKRKHRLKNVPPKLIVEVLRGERTGQWWFHIKSPNGRILCHSEGYHKRADCVRAIRRITGCQNWKVRVR